MSAHSRRYRLPWGGDTCSVRAYLREWKEVINAVEAQLPSYYVGGYDPGILLHHRNGGNYPSVSVPMSLVRDVIGKEAHDA